MKQHFTEDQWNELDEAEKQRLIEWTISKGEHASSMSARSIGHLIWFLDEHEATNNPGYECGFLARNYSKHPGQEIDTWIMSGDGPLVGRYYEQAELVDALWEAVKAVLKEGGESDTH